MVNSLVLVTNDLTKEGAKAFRIEKSEGFTDKQSYPADAPELIQDDDVFNSVVVSFGSMGIIYALVIEVESLIFSGGN